MGGGGGGEGDRTYRLKTENTGVIKPDIDPRSLRRTISVLYPSKFEVQFTRRKIYFGRLSNKIF